MEITFIKDTKIGTRNVNLFFIVLEVSPRATTTKEGSEIRTCKVADRSACINFSIWGELGSFVQPGDICRLTKAYVASWKGTPTLYMGKGGELAKTGEFCMIFNESVNMSDTLAPVSAPAAPPLAIAAPATATTTTTTTTNNPMVTTTTMTTNNANTGIQQAAPVLDID